MSNRIPATNIIMTGMPGSGKSTVGVLLAKRLGLGFVDTDLLIQQHAGCTLQDGQRGLSGVAGGKTCCSGWTWSGTWFPRGAAPSIARRR